MKIKNKFSETVLRRAGVALSLVVLVCSSGCDQQGGQLSQLTESFQKKIDEKDKQLVEARTAQKTELENKLQTLITELEKAHATPTAASAPSASPISVEKISEALEPMIKKVIQESIASSVSSAPQVSPTPILPRADNPAPNPSPVVRTRPNPPESFRPQNDPDSPPKRTPNNEAKKYNFDLPPMPSNR